MLITNEASQPLHDLQSLVQIQKSVIEDKILQTSKRAINYQISHVKYCQVGFQKLIDNTSCIDPGINAFKGFVLRLCILCVVLLILHFTRHLYALSCQGD